jgi:hypothetical protein
MSQMLCATCYHVAKPVSKTKGSFLIELALWIMLCLPGLIYSIWRLSSRANVCPQCGSESVIPLNSTRAQQILSGIKHR